MQIIVEPVVLWFKLILVLSEVATDGGAVDVCFRLGGGIGINEEKAERENGAAIRAFLVGTLAGR